MPLWRKLYNTVWLAFFCCVLIPRWLGSHAGGAVHAALGLLLLIVAWTNIKRLAALPVPERLKRVVKVTAGFAVFQLITGLASGVVAHLALDLPRVFQALHGIHVVCALAILAQTSSVATAYDMWEEKEFISPPRD
jgi:hypothetical protein